jgi:hypothetical protein
MPAAAIFAVIAVIQNVSKFVKSGKKVRFVEVRGGFFCFFTKKVTFFNKK